MSFELFLSMDQDRREVIRRSISLPCTWQAIAPATEFSEVLDLLLGNSGMQLLLAIGDLNRELNETFNDTSEPHQHRSGKNNVAAYRSLIQDRENSRTLELINNKLDLLVQHAVYPTPPHRYDICLSADGCSISLNAPEDQNIVVGTRLGLHFALPNEQNILCVGTVVGAVAGADGTCRIKFDEFFPGDDRLLARFLLMAPNAVSEEPIPDEA